MKFYLVKIRLIFNLASHNSNYHCPTRFKKIFRFKKVNFSFIRDVVFGRSVAGHDSRARDTHTSLQRGQGNPASGVSAGESDQAGGATQLPHVAPGQVAARGGLVSQGEARGDPSDRTAPPAATGANKTARRNRRWRSCCTHGRSIPTILSTCAAGAVNGGAATND